MSCGVGWAGGGGELVGWWGRWSTGSWLLGCLVAWLLDRFDAWVTWLLGLAAEFPVSWVASVLHL